MADVLPQWTEEQRLNATKYGVCTECGTPRETEMIATTDDNGELEVVHRFDPTTCEHMMKAA